MTAVYVLRASIEVLEASDGKVYLLRAGASDLVVAEPDVVDRTLLKALERPVGIEALVERTGATAEVVREKIDALCAVEVLASWPEDGPALDEDAAMRFDRQLPYLAEFGPPEERQRALADAAVAIIGCGGLGTWALGALACAGIGSFILVDDDRIEPSNLNRQVLYVEEEVGRLKVECAAEWLRRFAPRTAVRTLDRRIESVADVAPLAREADMVLLLADWPPYELERWVNAACVAAGTPYIACGQATPIMKIGPMFVPGRTACFACEETQLRADSPFYDEVVTMRRRDGRFAMTLGPASGLVGTMLSIEVMHALLGRPAATEGRALLLDIQSFQTWWEPVARDLACAVCAVRDQVPQ